MVFTVVSTMWWISASLTGDAGARMMWSPRLPPADPVPGYSEMLYGSCMPTKIVSDMHFSASSASS